MRACVVALLVGGSAVLGAACGGGEGGGGAEDDGAVTGRVVSLREDAYCVTPDRGATQTCVEIPDPGAVQGVDVGECVTTPRDLTVEGGRIEVVDEAACAAGDLGDDAPES